MKWVLSLVLLAAGGLPAIADQVLYRDGTSARGTVIAEHNDVYTFNSRTHGTHSVAKERVRFVLYEDELRAADRLGLARARAFCTDPSSAPVDILPADAYAEALLESIRGAQKYIYVMTYSLSGSQSGIIGDIYDALQERAAEGVKVYVIVPAGSRAAAGVKIAAMNYAETLAASGIQVRFLQQHKVQHKKLVIVDTRKAFVGSSNLTSAAVTHNIELNIATEQPTFVEAAVKDFRSMLRRAKTIDKLTL